MVNRIKSFRKLFSGNSSEAILELFNAPVNDKNVLGTVSIKNGQRCVLGTVLSVDPFLDSYLLSV